MYPYVNSRCLGFALLLLMAYWQQWNSCPCYWRPKDSHWVIDAEDGEAVDQGCLLDHDGLALLLRQLLPSSSSSLHPLSCICSTPSTNPIAGLSQASFYLTSLPFRSHSYIRLPELSPLSEHRFLPSRNQLGKLAILRVLLPWKLSSLCLPLFLLICDIF